MSCCEKNFSDIDFARGRLDLASLSLKGPLDEPSRWDFNSTGTLGKIAVKHAKLPGSDEFDRRKV